MPRRLIRHAWAPRAGALLLALVVCASSASLALAETDATRVTRRGPCSGLSHWALTIRKIDRATLGVRLVVAGGRADQRWNVFMDHKVGGYFEGFFAGSRISGTGGYFVVRRRVENLAGVDTIRFGASNTKSLETCSGRTRL